MIEGISDEARWQELQTELQLNPQEVRAAEALIGAVARSGSCEGVVALADVLPAGAGSVDEDEQMKGLADSMQQVWRLRRGDVKVAFHLVEEWKVSDDILSFRLSPRVKALFFGGAG